MPNLFMYELMDLFYHHILHFTIQFDIPGFIPGVCVRFALSVPSLCHY